MAAQNRREIGAWGPIKNEIIEKYAKSYTTILSKKSWCTTMYVDVFAGSPFNTLRRTGELVPGSAQRSLNVTPPFDQYLFVDADQTKVADLHEMVRGRAGARVVHGDGNEVLRRDVIPRLETNRKLRSLILLDPYGLDLEWHVVERLGKTTRAEIILNFPIMDINRNAVHRTADTIQDKSMHRMTRWWGDDSWRTSFFEPDHQLNLFGDPARERKVVDNDGIVAAYCSRLRQRAGFKFVAAPFPVVNSKNATLYYLVFATPQPVASDIMRQILSKYR
jgi:three-Cys-motif partner protein